MVLKSHVKCLQDISMQFLLKTLTLYFIRIHYQEYRRLISREPLFFGITQTGMRIEVMG